MKTTRSDLDRVQRIAVEPETRSRAEASRPARGCKRWHPLAPGRRYGTRSPLSEYISLHLSLKLATNSGPLSRIKWEIYFYKQVCFVSFIETRLLCEITIQHYYHIGSTDQRLLTLIIFLKINKNKNFPIKENYYVLFWFGLFGFYGISTIKDYLMPNPIYRYILNIYDFVWLGFMVYQTLMIFSCQILFIHIYIC